MKKIKNILICGLGAIGSICAVKIAQNKNARLKILADKSRIEYYKKNPLCFNNKTFDFDYIEPNSKDFFADFHIYVSVLLFL